MPRIILQLPAKGIEGEYTVKTNPDGSSQIEIDPYFFNASGPAPVAYLSSVDDNDRVVCKSALQVIGSNGGYKLVDVTKKVPPRFAGKKKPATPGTPTPPEAPAEAKGAKA